MTRSLSNVASRLRLPIAAAASALLVLSGCAAGQSAETSQPYNPSDGRNVNIPEDAGFNDPYMAVRNALVVSDGGAASIIVTLVNNGPETDLLTEAKIGDQTAAFVGGPVEIAPDQRVAIGGGSERVALVAEGGVEPGDFVELTLTFTNAGTTTLEVLVIPSDDEYAAPVEDA
jgi:copper(I)-binding protein